MNLPNWFSRMGRAVSFAMALLCGGVIVFLGLEVARDLRLLNSANSDNVQWTLSQAEVEFLELAHVVHDAGIYVTDDLEPMVEEFDIFYSRIATFRNGALYADLRQLPEFAEPLGTVVTMLDTLVPLIDGPRPELRGHLVQIETGLQDIRVNLRQLATAGLNFFARQSDEQRGNVAETLTGVALLTAMLVAALAFLLRRAHLSSRQRERRGVELTAAYARLNTILGTSLDAVVVSDPDGNVLQFSPAAERIFGYSLDEVIGRNIGRLIVPDHLRAAHDAGMTRMYASGEKRMVGHGRVRLEAMRKNGNIFPVELALETAQSGDAEIVIAFLRDISPRVAAENELVEARDKALAGEEAKAEFLAMMTHEIRTPLNGVLGNLALLEETVLSPDQARYARNMSISGDLLMSHVDAVLDVTRFESGVSTAKANVVNLGRLVQDIVDSQTHAAETNGNALQWGWIGEGLDWVTTETSRLQQVLLNLLGNAIKFTRQGHIRIELELVAPEDQAVGMPAGLDSLEIRIIDTGVGIAEADLPQVFDDFTTLASPMTHNAAGTGLGLGIARRFVRAMGGEIGAESTLGEGSVFWLRIPVMRAAAPVDHGTAIPDETPVTGRDILLVEDNEINLQLAREMLKLQGHSVTIARDGQKGLDAANAHQYDLILMDIRMPVMDGLAATRAIRDGQGASRTAPIIALSANVLPEARARFMKEGMSDFLGKPLNKAELAQVIARFCVAGDRIAYDRQPVTPPAAATAATLAAKTGTATAIEAADDPMAALMSRYLDETRVLFDWLATDPQDETEIAERAHKIAGSAAVFGHPDLRNALVRVETAADAGDRAALLVAIAGAQAAWDAAPNPSLV
jgi:PAS domain S-box-containing protein